MNVTIRTRYAARPGSNVGAYRAMGAGRSFTAPPRQDLNAGTAEEIAARGLASILSGFDASNVRAWARRVDPVTWEGRRQTHGTKPPRPSGEPTPPEAVSIRRAALGPASAARLFPASGTVTAWEVAL